MPIYLGLDSSTQSLSAIAIDVEAGKRDVVFEASLVFDEALPEYGTRHGVLPNDDPAVVVSSPLMWADALDRILALVARGIDVSRLEAIAGSAQQHGSVYLNGSAGDALGSLNPAQALAAQIGGIFSRHVSPVWMDSSTTKECAEITDAVGGPAVLAARTGSRAFERFTGPQIRKFFKREPEAYAGTDRVHLVSSFLASLLAGGQAPIEPGDGSGMNLMDLRARAWWPPAVDATAPGLVSKLPPIVPSDSIVGRLSSYWQARYGLPAAHLVAWTGDNPSSLIGTGLVTEGRVSISLGTSDVIFGLMREPRVNAGGAGHVFGAPTGEFMGLTVFRNGSLARERIRDHFGLTWEAFSEALRVTPPGNNAALMLPWFEPEITPLNPRRHDEPFRQHLAAGDGQANVRAVVEAQMLALKRHSSWMGTTPGTIYATGGAAGNVEILQVMADVFGADVYRFDVANAACQGAAIRAWHASRRAAGEMIAWEDAVRGLAEPAAASRIRSNPGGRAIYRVMEGAQAAFEARVLTEGSP